MTIISDTSVITYLIQLNHLDLLQSLFEEVIISEKVREELSRIEDQAQLLNRTNWIKEIKLSNTTLYESLLDELDPGEAESIALAIELNADLLLIDERKGRKIAEKYSIRITGLLGILIESKKDGLIEKLKPLLDKLIYEMGFRINPKLYQEVLRIVEE